MTYPIRYHPQDTVFGSGWHIDYSASNTSFLAATVANHQDLSMGPSGYSTDGGSTWSQFSTMPGGAAVNVAGSASGTFGFGSIHVGTPSNIVWVSSYGHGAMYTTNQGTTWNAVTISGVTGSNINFQPYYVYRRCCAAEKTASAVGTFYMLVTSKGFYRSTDGGATWTQQSTFTPFSGPDWTWHVQLKCVYGNPGHLFTTPGPLGPWTATDLTTPFMRSTDGGATWTTLSGVTGVRSFDFGKAAPGQTYPAIYITGAVGGVFGVYVSLDNAGSWQLLSTQPDNTTTHLHNVAASKDIFGKHWIAGSGAGLLVGQLT